MMQTEYQEPDFNQPEIEYTNKNRVSCNGGGGALGHPLTYYTIGASGYVECTYCDKKFVYKPS